MDFYLNQPQGSLANSFGGQSALNGSITVVRGSLLPMRFLPFTGGGAVAAAPWALPASFALQLTGKLATESGDDPTAIVSANAFTVDSTGFIYGGSLDLGTVQVAQAFVGASLVNPQTASYTLVASDVTQLVALNMSGAGSITLPADSVIAYNATTPVQVWLMATGTGTINVGKDSSQTLLFSRLANGVLTGGVPVLATKTAANQWTLSPPVEPASITLNAEWAYADTTGSPVRYVRIPSFQLTINNWVYNGGEGSPASTGSPAAYALTSAVTTAVAAEATARTTADATEATARAAAVAAEAAARAAADALLTPYLLTTTALVDGSSLPLASYTLAAADGFQRHQAAYNGAFVLNIPANSAVPIPVGWWTVIDRLIGGGTTITPTSGVVVNSLNGVLAQALADAGMSIYLVKTNTDVWMATLTRPPSAYEIEHATRLNILTDVTVSGGTVAWNMANGINAKLTFGAYATRVLGAPSNMPPAGTSGRLLIKQDSVGSRTITYNAAFSVPVTIALNTGANSYTPLNWIYDGSLIVLTKG